MCKINQIPLLFTDCHHLSVVAAIEPCVETHVPGRPALYCGPAEWDLTTVTELESHPSRCKNCRSRFNESTVKKTNESSKMTRGKQVDDLISFSSQSEQQDHKIEQRLVTKEQCEEKKQLNKHVLKKQSKKPVLKNQQVEYPRPVKEEKQQSNKHVLKNQQVEEDERLVKENQEQEMEDDDESLKKEAAKYGVSVKEYKAIVRECKAVSATQQKKNISMWQEEPSSSEEVGGENKAPEPNM